MAEAAVQNPVNRFFCHKCSLEINPVLPDYVCPRCNSGFIEELEENEDSNREYNEEDQELGPRTLEQLWGQLFQNLDGNSESDQDRQYRLRRRYRRSHDGSMRPSNSLYIGDRSDSYNDSSNNRQGRSAPNRTPMSPMPPFDGLPLEEIIQQVLTNLSSGGLHNSGFPILFNLHGNPGDYAWGRSGLDTIVSQLINQMDGSGPPPLSTEVISQIPTVSITREQVSKALQCTVCMEDFKVGESVRKLQCTHHFHQNCIVPWLELHGTCPICRQILNNDSTEMEHDGAESTTTGSSSSSSSYTSSSDPSNSSYGGSSTSGNTTPTQSSSPNSNTENPVMPSVYDFNEEVD